MREAALELSAKWKKRGVDLGLGIGIAQGFATVGAIGFEGRIDYGAIGTVTNLAARLCQQAKAGEIILSQRVYAEVGDAIEAEDLGELQLHGFARPAHAYRWLGAPGAAARAAVAARRIDSRVRTADLRIHIRQLCCLGVTGEQLMPSLLKSVRQLVGAESAAFFWVDAQGDMTSLYAERLLPAPVMQLYFERFYDAGESSFRRAFAERARRDDPVVAVSASTAAERSAYYNEVMRHLDAHHVLYGVVREQGEALGQLSLYRPKSARTFSTAERGELTAIMRYVAHGVSARTRADAGAQALLDTADDAVFLIAADGSLREVSPVGAEAARAGDARPHRAGRGACRRRRKRAARAAPTGRAVARRT